MATPVSSSHEKYLFWKVAIQKYCSEKELLHITGIQEPIVKTYEECIWIIGRVAHHKISYEFCKTFKNIYFEEYLWTTAFGSRLESHVEIEPQRFTNFTLSCLH